MRYKSWFPLELANVEHVLDPSPLMPPTELFLLLVAEAAADLGGLGCRIVVTYILYCSKSRECKLIPVSLSFNNLTQQLLASAP
jgi:hypothetical protein